MTEGRHTVLRILGGREDASIDFVVCALYVSI